MRYFTILFGFLFLFLSVGCTSTANLQSDRFSRTEVYKVDKSQDEIFVSINDWMARNIGDSKESIRYKDKEAGRISARIVFEKPCGVLDVKQQIVSNLVVETKDGAYRVEILPQYKIDPTGEYPAIDTRCLPIKPAMDSWFNEIENHVKGENEDDW